MKKIQSFEEHQSKVAEEDKSKTDSYEPPKYVIKPAKGDKGFALLRSLLDKVKKVIEPGIWST